jgi:hypothetical protein
VAREGAPLKRSRRGLGGAAVPPSHPRRSKEDRPHHLRSPLCQPPQALTLTTEWQTLRLAPASAATRRTDAKRAVAQTFASIMQARYPGSMWLPVFSTNGNASPRSRKGMHVLPTPHDLDAISDVPTAASAATDVDDIDRGRE